MKLDELYRMYCSCYFGVREMDEYGSKEFVLKEISDFIKDFVKDNPIDDFVAGALTSLGILFEFVGFYNNNHEVSLKQRKQELLMRKRI